MPRIRRCRILFERTRIPVIQACVRAFGFLGLAVLMIGCAPAAPPTSNPTLPNPPTFTWPSLPTKSPADSVRTVAVDGLARNYLLYIPPGLSVSTPAPLVLVFHGHRMNGEYMLAMTGFNALADANQFIVAYPNGTGLMETLSFNSGLCCGSAQKNNIDEAAFVRGILSDLNAIAAIDPARVYVTGFSNGAMLAYRLACELSDTIAAIAPVAGNLGYGPCRPRGKVSILHIQGLSDDSIPYADDDLEPDLNPDIRSVQGSVALWASFDGCAGLPDENRNGIATHTVYSACAGGTAVELYSLYGIGHIWPPESLWPTSRVIWEFFEAHPKA
jgi:polyhydroxybutyrate depolymerase